MGCNERDVLLDVVRPMLNGSSTGWRFCESDTTDTSLVFSADVEDDAFLNDVRNGQQGFANGTTMFAVLRTVQRRLNHIRTDRTVVEVKAVYPPENRVNSNIA